MPPLTPELRAAQTWMGRAQAIDTLTPQQLCNVQLPEDLARPWLLTVYAQTVGGALIAPTNPVGPVAGAVIIATTSLPSALQVRIGQQLVTMDYPGRGGVFAVSPCSQCNVSLVASWAGGVAPAANAVPVYSARLAEAEGAGICQPTLAVPRYTYSLGNVTPGGPVFGLVPVRATALTLYPGDIAGAGTERLQLTWLDDAGFTVAVNSIKPGPGPAAGDGGGHELIPWVIPPRATQWSLELFGVEDVQSTLVFHLSL